MEMDEIPPELIKAIRREHFAEIKNSLKEMGYGIVCPKCFHSLTLVLIDSLK